MFLELEEEVVELGCGGDGGEAEAGFGGVLEVGAGVGEEDEGHGRQRLAAACGMGMGVRSCCRGLMDVCLVLVSNDYGDGCFLALAKGQDLIF